MERLTSDSLRSLRSLVALPLMVALLGNTGCPQEPEQDNSGNDDGQTVAPAGDYGDAPDGYPTRYSPGEDVATLGLFPSAYTTTNSRTGLPGGHALDPSDAWLGPDASVERGVLDSEDPDLTHNMTDDDRRDDGVIVLRPFGPLGVEAEVLVSASPSASPDGWYLNVLLDADGDGRWANSGPLDEWRLVNEPITVVPGGTTTVTLQDFWPTPSRRQAWLRLSLTDAPVDVATFGDEGWDGSGAFERGEIEDHLVLRPVVDTAWADDEDWDSDERSRSEEVERVREAIDAMRNVAERTEVELDAQELFVALALETSITASAEADAFASAAATAESAAEASASSASSAASEASMSASSASSASAAVGCAVASASASSSASASASVAADASASASSAASATASARADADAHAAVAATAAATAQVEADAFALALAFATAHADAIAVAYADASASADARAEAWADAYAYADAYAEALAFGWWAEACADAFAIAFADASADVSVHADAAAQALAIAIAEADAFALAAADARVHAAAAVAAAADAEASAGFAASFSSSASFSAAFAADALALATGAATAVAETDALAIALATGACEDEYCETWIETSTELEGALDVCAMDLAGADGELDACYQALDGGLPFEPSGAPTPLNEMMISSADSIPWSLPGQPVVLSVPNDSLFDGAIGNPGCCEMYDITITCGE